jgi:hypothetical protein
VVSLVAATFEAGQKTISQVKRMKSSKKIGTRGDTAPNTYSVPDRSNEK